MINHNGKNIGFLDSYKIGLFESLNFSKTLKSNNLSVERYLSEVAKEFGESFFVDCIFDNSNLLSKNIFRNLKKGLNKHIILEKNTVHIPIQEFLESINFGIYVEISNLNESNKKEDITFEKISSILNGKSVEPNFVEVSENTYDEQQIIQMFRSVTENLKSNQEIKNGYYIITFE